ncbi:DUF6158 family protein [Micromonospora echinofusca]|uniref:DUF6158 family protein n=1 Tax=Micromonospora echinofusca TaxID=47858 RepID=UPI003F76E43B
MTESVRRDGYPSTSPGGSVDASPEQRMPEWDTAHTGDVGVDVAEPEPMGIDPADLADEDLIREIHSLHRTRLDTLRHATDAALANHLRRTAELETEYLTRHPGREVDPGRLRDL